MWERKELKQRAKACLKLYYWPAVLVVLIASVLGGSSGFTMPAASGGNVAESVETITELPEVYPSDSDISYEYEEESVPAPEEGAPVSGGDTAQNAALAIGVGILVVVLAVAAAIGAGFSFLYPTPCRLEAAATYGEPAGDAFRRRGKAVLGLRLRQLLKTVKTMFFRDLYIFLWTLLLVIPGIVKHYQYYLVPYILSENPDMDTRQALDVSRSMMEGNKFRVFVLELSFIGWLILGTLLCGVGTIFVAPYIEATKAELYAVLRCGAQPASLKGFEV